MQIVNNYDKSVYNGDIGAVSAVNHEDETLTVAFPDAAGHQRSRLRVRRYGRADIGV